MKLFDGEHVFWGSKDEIYFRDLLLEEGRDDAEFVDDFAVETSWGFDFSYGEGQGFLSFRSFEIKLWYLLQLFQQISLHHDDIVLDYVR
jgi:hypothetical protein